MRRLVVAGCAVLKDEVERILRGRDLAGIEFRWLKAGYHVVPELLEAKLAEVLRDMAGAEDRVRVILGERCLPESRQVSGSWPTLPTANCLTAILGTDRLRELEAGPAMVVTTAWIRDIFLSRDPELPVWGEADFRMNLGRYERIVVLDTGGEPLTDEETLMAFDLTGRILEFESAALDHLERLLLDLLGLTP